MIGKKTIWLLSLCLLSVLLSSGCSVNTISPEQPTISSEESSDTSGNEAPDLPNDENQSETPIQPTISSEESVGTSGSEAAEVPNGENQSETPEPDVYRQQAETVLSGMTLHEKICQMFIVAPEALVNVSPVTVAGEEMRTALEHCPVGGLFFNRTNFIYREQVSDMLTNVQSDSAIPLFLTCDEEGGRVNRLMSTVGTTYIGPMLNYKDEGVETAFSNACTIGSDMSALGFNLDLAPVADVWSNPSNEVIGDRAYSDNFQQAAELIPATVEGFHAGGVACTLKHFPGHGDTSTDSHDGAVYIGKTLEELRRNELLPFQAGIRAGADIVMVGHLIVETIDSEPAPFSYAIVTTLLRDEMGFSGVVMTDSLQMQAMTDYYSSGETVVNAVQAGVDLLLCPPDLPEAVTALETAVENHTITEERIDESVLRILYLKAKTEQYSK